MRWQYAANRPRDRRLDHLAGVRLFLCHTLQVRKTRRPLLFLALITLFGGYLVKIYAWKSILGREGILNKFLLGIGGIDQPLDALLYSVNGVVITLTYFLLPFAILPIYGNLRPSARQQSRQRATSAPDVGRSSATS